jgi:hypothetical protein
LQRGEAQERLERNTPINKWISHPPQLPIFLLSPHRPSGCFLTLRMMQLTTQTLIMCTQSFRLPCGMLLMLHKSKYDSWRSTGLSTSWSQLRGGGEAGMSESAGGNGGGGNGGGFGGEGGGGDCTAGQEGQG